MQHSLELPAVALKNALGGLSKVISGRSTLPVLGCVRVEATPNGAARIQATDLDSFLTCHVQGSPGGFPACLIPFDPLNRIVKGTKNPLRLVQEDGKLTVQSSFGTATVAQTLGTLPPEEWPPLPEVPAPTYTGEAAFKQSLREALECVSSNSSRYVLTGACLDLSRPDCHCVVGTDGRHLYSANTFQFDLPKSVIIPPRKFLGWSGFNQDGDWRVALSLDKDQQPFWVQLQSDHWSFLTKPISGDFPGWRHVVPADPNATTVTLSEAAIELMLDALPRLPGGDDLDQPVTLVVAGGQLGLSAKAKGEAHANEVPVPDARVLGKDIRLRLNRSFVTKALRFGFTTFELRDEFGPILFTAPGRNLIAMPLREGPLPATTATPQTTPQPSAEAAAPASPSAGQAESPATDERNTMPAETTLTPPRRGNLQPIKVEGNNGNNTNGSALAAAVTQIETIKTALRDVILDLNTTLDLLRAAEKEKKASFKEVESVRATLRSLQKVAI